MGSPVSLRCTFTRSLIVFGVSIAIARAQGWTGTAETGYVLPERPFRWTPPEVSENRALSALGSMTNRPMIRPDLSLTLEGSVESGVVRITERLRDIVRPLTRKWDTALTRVYSFVEVPRLTRWSLAPKLPIRIVVTGFDDKSKSAKVLLLTNETDGTWSQQTLVSEKGAQWWNASLVGSRLYVFDMLRASIRRAIDTDRDGLPETLDVDFDCALDSLTASRPSWALNFDLGRVVGIRPHSAHLALFSLRRMDCFPQQETEYFIDEEGDRPVLSLQRPQPWPRSDILGKLVAGQRRIAIDSHSGEDVTIVRELDDGTISELTSGSTVTANIGSSIDLTDPLEAGWRVRVQSLRKGWHPSPWTIVEDSFRTILFPVQRPEWPITGLVQGRVLTLEGDNFKEHHQATYRGDDERETLRLPTRWIDRHRIEITLPTFADVDAHRLRGLCRRGLLRLVDAADGTPASNDLHVFIGYE